MLKKNECARDLAVSHLKSLPEDLLPSLGLRYLTHFYKFIYASSLEEIINYKSARCIITYRADSFWRRVVISTFPSFIVAILPKILEKKIQNCLWSTKKCPNPSPQIAFMFSTRKGKGHGSELLRRCNLSPLYVKTIKGGRAEKFYKKNGFNEYEVFEYAKKTYIMLVKN
ncbi:hypothetical protein QPK87_26020 [Kamptonema cortianum]|jgi:hypothetical protein|nr:hypothetical protein [Kamptonema cortianum]